MNAVSRINALALCSAFLMSGLAAQDAARGAQLTPARPAAPQAIMSQSVSDKVLDLTVTADDAADQKFLGLILVSFESSTTRYIWNMPPLLTRHAVLAAGFAHRDYHYALARSRLPKGHEVFAQGLIFDSRGITTTAVCKLGEPTSL